MKRTSTFILATVVCIIAVVTIAVCALLSKPLNTVSEMADRTIFNGTQHVWEYEDFHRKVNAYEEQLNIWKSATLRITELEARGYYGTQEYNNEVMRRDGAFDTINRIIREYNKSSEIFYKNIWKDKGLPDRLELPQVMNEW